MKWLLRNVRRRAAFALRNPRYATTAIMRELILADERFLSHITGVSLGQIRAYMNEPISTPAFAELLATAEQTFHRLSIESADLYAKRVLVQYAALRALAPQCVVETGVANGVSSSYLLLALHKNAKGCLHSVGLDDPAFLPPGAKPGWLVPTWLGGAWHAHIGDARQILPSLLRQLGSIDVFIHDSLHTYEHMMWEFETAYPFLRRGGLLFSDDALCNNAFHDFAHQVRASHAKILRGVGFLRKTAP